MIKMRGSIYHADISNGFNVRVYSTEPPEDTVERQCHFLFFLHINKLGKIKDLFQRTNKGHFFLK